MLRCGVVFGVLCLVGSGAAAEEAKKDQAKLQGSWQVVSIEDSGKKGSEQEARSIILVFSGTKMADKIDGKAEHEYTFTLNPAKDPKWIDLTEVGEGKDRKAQGIYHLQGDSLK